MITMRSVCFATAILTTGVMSGGFNDVPLGEDTFLDGKRGFWKKTENSTCLVEPTPMCKYKSWTLCEFEGTSWCAFEDFKCAKDKVGCIDEDGKDVDGFIEMECEEPDNKCGDSFCGTAPLNDDCQCVTDAVGRGDRCIRSDMPFPPNCRKVVSSCTSCSDYCHCNSSSSRRNENSSAVSFGGLSLWMKGRSSHRRRERKSRQNNRSSRGNRTNNGNVAAHSPANNSSHAMVAYRRSSSLSSTSSGHEHSAGYNNSMMSSPSTPVDDSAPSMPNQHSPFYRFLSSLSHRCTSPTSSVNEDDIMRSSYLDVNRGCSNISDGSDNDGLNNYGMISVKHGLMSKCKQSLGRLRQYGGVPSTRLSSLRPFVVPTVISDTREEGGSLVVDVTPRFVAYFEVTIVKKQGHEDSLESQQSEQHEHRNHRNHNMPIHHQNNNGQHAHYPPPLHARRNRRRMPHRAAFMPVHLPLPVDAPAMALGGLDWPRQLFHHDDIQQQRHECVAIGLSTKQFSPTNKMPGWDMESYGYHGDDGGIFHGQGDMLSRYGPAFGPGDTVGCGLEYSTRKMFFVKNGVFLGYAFGNDGNGGGLRKEVVESGLYPTVGVDTECPVSVNFGERPFKFNLKEFAAAGSSVGGAEGDRESLEGLE